MRRRQRQCSSLPGWLCAAAVALFAATAANSLEKLDQIELFEVSKLRSETRQLKLSNKLDECRAFVGKVGDQLAGEHRPDADQVIGKLIERVRAASDPLKSGHRNLLDFLADCRAQLSGGSGNASAAEPKPGEQTKPTDEQRQPAPAASDFFNEHKVQVTLSDQLLARVAQLEASERELRAKLATSEHNERKLTSQLIELKNDMDRLETEGHLQSSRAQGLLRDCQARLHAAEFKSANFEQARERANVAELGSCLKDLQELKEREQHGATVWLAGLNQCQSDLRELKSARDQLEQRLGDRQRELAVCQRELMYHRQSASGGRVRSQTWGKENYF